MRKKNMKTKIKIAQISILVSTLLLTASPVRADDLEGVADPVRILFGAEILLESGN